MIWLNSAELDNGIEGKDKDYFCENKSKCLELQKRIFQEKLLWLGKLILSVLRTEPRALYMLRKYFTAGL